MRFLLAEFHLHISKCMFETLSYKDSNFGVFDSIIFGVNPIEYIVEASPNQPESRCGRVVLSNGQREHNNASALSPWLKASRFALGRSGVRISSSALFSGVILAMVNFC